MKCVVWFRRDLWVEDNPALAAAARTAGEVVPAYVWSPEEDEKLMNHVAQYGYGCWSSVAKIAGTVPTYSRIPSSLRPL